jgi:hypothetical protein
VGACGSREYRVGGGAKRGANAPQEDERISMGTQQKNSRI